MSNIYGKAYAFTAFTPMKRWKTPFLRAFFWIVPILAMNWAQRLLGYFPLVQAQARLVELSFIHFARWSIVPAGFWPKLDDSQPKDRTKYDYLMFCSNFNGTWEQYIDAFSEIIPEGMNWIWRWSEQFPGARPITPFLGYIRRVQSDCEYYFGAYPGASATDVRQALLLQQQLEAFADRSAHLDAVRFAGEYREFLISVQNCFGSTGLDPYVVDWEELLFPDNAAPDAPLTIAGVPAAAPGN